MTKKANKRTNFSVLVEQVLRGFEMFCREAALRPFSIENHDLVEIHAEWRDKHHEDDARVEQHFVLSLAEHDDDDYDDVSRTPFVESNLRLALDLPRTITDGDESDRVSGRRVWLTSDRRRGLPDDVMDRLQLIALKTLADFNIADFSEYAHVKEYARGLKRQIALAGRGHGRGGGAAKARSGARTAKEAVLTGV